MFLEQVVALGSSDAPALARWCLGYEHLRLDIRLISQLWPVVAMEGEGHWWPSAARRTEKEWTAMAFSVTVSTMI